MRVEWLDFELTECAITRGRLWWKRRAVLRLTHTWEFANSGYQASDAMCSMLYAARAQEFRRRQDADDWQPIRRRRSLPVVRT